MSIKEHPPQPEAANAPVHVPVLLSATVDKLQPMAGESYLDLTAGYGGHARVFLEKTDNYLGSVLVDRDHNAIATLDDLAAQGVRLMHTDFVSAAQELVQEGRTFDIILADLGVSSPQLRFVASPRLLGKILLNPPVLQTVKANNTNAPTFAQEAWQ